MAETLKLPSNILPEYNRQITLRKWGANGHTYRVTGYPCERCGQCTGRSTKDHFPTPEKCSGMTGCSSISGMYMEGNMYIAGRKSGLDAVFGEYADDKKLALIDGGPLLGRQTQQSDLLGLRKAAEQVPSKSSIAREYGTRIHAAMEAVLVADQQDEEVSIDPDLAQPVHNIQEWLASHEYHILDVEVAVYHPEMRYAGRIDCVAERNGNITLFDWKSGNLYMNAQVQLAGYALAYEQITGIRPAACWVLRANADDFQAAEVITLNAAKEAFMGLYDAKMAWDQLTWTED
jgi:deoxycytidylate deaminase